MNKDWDKLLTVNDIALSINMFIDNHADLNIKNKDGQTLLYELVKQYHNRKKPQLLLTAIQLLLINGAIPTNTLRYNPLRVAVIYNSLDVAKILLEHGATNIKLIDGTTLSDETENPEMKKLLSGKY